MKRMLSKKPSHVGSGDGKGSLLTCVRELAEKKGIWMAAFSLLFLGAVFGTTAPQVIAAIPSPEFDAVRMQYLWILVTGCGFLAALAVLLWKKKERPGWLYPASLLVLGLLYMTVLTPFSAPDEARHFISAYRLSNQLMGKQVTADDAFYASASDQQKEWIDKGANVLVREMDEREQPYTGVGRDAYDFILSQRFTRDASEGVSVRAESPVKTTPVVFLPQALGITLARLLHVGYVPLIYMGRIFNLLAFTGLCVLAVRFMPFKKELLIAVSMLPMTLHLASSNSYDASLIGLSLLFLAYCLHLAFEKKRIVWWDVGLLALLLVLLEPCKIVYLPIAGICLMIPSAKFRSKKEYYTSVAVVLGVLILAVVLINQVMLSSYLTDTENYISWDGASGYTMQDVLREPYHIFTMYYETLVTQFDYYQATMLGAFLGNLDPHLNVPYFCLFLLWMVLFLCSVKREGEYVPMKASQKLWAAFLIFISICLTLASMLLGWTPKGYTYILGIQGRYFLPLLPLALLLLFDDHLVIKKDLTKGAFYTGCFVSVYALIRICSMASVR